MITKCSIHILRYNTITSKYVYSSKSILLIQKLHTQSSTSKTKRQYPSISLYDNLHPPGFESATKDTTFIHSATPYSDKYYQPLISQGGKGFDRIILPKDFTAENQELSKEDEISVNQESLQAIVSSFDAPIDGAIGYGSGILPQDGYDQQPVKPELDFIFLVEDTAKFHQSNVFRNPSHYSNKSLKIINRIQGKDGIYFNPFVKINEKLVKYGVVSKKSALLDLSEWHSLYFAGRLQKPVNFIVDNDPMIKFLNQYNLKNAMTIAIFLINSSQFTERELYEQITKLSYLGDFRMYIGGENPNKAKNIVSKQFYHFKKLYEPILNFFIHKNYLIILNNDAVNRTFKTNLNANNRIKLISCLPLKFRQQLYGRYYEKSIKEIVVDEKLPDNLTKIISRTIFASSIKQGIRGLLTAGLFNSIRYAIAKQMKFWNGK
ncbi:tam41 Phosphatidate cytidylyltransferase [Candida maltosa Xu316]